MSQTFYEGLTDLLAWEDDFHFSDVLDSILVNHVSKQFAVFLARLGEADPAKAESLRRRMKGISDRLLSQMLTAPHVYYLLTYTTDDQASADFLLNGLDAEKIRLGRMLPREHGIWSVLGDVYYPPRAPEADGGGKPIPGPGERYRAPRLPNDIAVDTCSPITRGTLAEVSGGDAPFTADESAITLGKLERSVQGLQKANPRAAKFLSRFAKVIVLRRDSDPAQYTSASTRLVTGRPILRNPHLDDATVESITDGLVHETIHSVIDIIELKLPMIQDRSARGERVASPWSGRSLDLNTYLQACFVWFGLWNLWLSAMGEPSFDRERVVKLLALSGRGFDAGIISPLSSVRTALHPSVLVALEGAEQNVRTDLELVHAASASVRC